MARHATVCVCTGVSPYAEAEMEEGGWFGSIADTLSTASMPDSWAGCAPKCKKGSACPPSYIMRAAEIHSCDMTDRKDRYGRRVGRNRAQTRAHERRDRHAGWSQDSADSRAKTSFASRKTGLPTGATGRENDENIVVARCPIWAIIFAREWCLRCVHIRVRADAARGRGGPSRVHISHY